MLLEFVLALIGIVLFVSVVVKVWVWVNQMIVQRQEAFQAGRLAAGRKDTSQRDRMTQFAPPQLRLFDEPLTPGARAVPKPADLKAPCPAAEQGYAEAEVDYKKAQRIYGEYDEDRGIIVGPIAEHQKSMQDAAQRICKSSKPTMADHGCPDCIQEVTIDGTTYQLTVETDARCVGVGGESDPVDENWSRCAKYWFDAATRENNNRRRRRYLDAAWNCLCNVQALQGYIEGLAGRVKELTKQADAWTQRADWLIRKADCECLRGNSDRFKRCQDDEMLKKPKPAKPPEANEQVPPPPALRGGNRHGCY